jgi:hypothetical protein
MSYGSYTAVVKHLTTVSIVLTVLAAIGAAIFVTTREAENDRLAKLLRSDSITDNLAAVELLEHHSFDTVLLRLKPILNTQSEASIKAQSMLVSIAFKEDRIDDLDPQFIDDDLYDAALWWVSETHQNDPQFDSITFQHIAIDAEASPWIRRLAALHCKTITSSTQEDLISMAPHDRDGSVLLTVLAIDRHIPNEMLPSLIDTWANSYDLELQIAAILLASLSDNTIPEIASSNSFLATISTICSEKHEALAWRSIHLENGMIRPDIALAGLIVDESRFLPILIDSARAGLWVHPDHPIELARRFAPKVSALIPSALLNQEESRDKWWSLFACGLLQEQR